MRRSWIAWLAVAALLATVAWYFRGAIRESVYALSRPALPVARPFAVPAPEAAAIVIPSPTSTKKASPSVNPSGRPAASTSTDPFVWAGDLPKTANLAVPFLSQAPKMDWSLPYQEACEEASSVMVNAYYKGRTQKFQPEEGDKAILDLVSFENKLLGFYEDTTAEQTASVIKNYFGYRNVVVRENPTADLIKRAIANGFPVMVPAYGKALANPNFRNGGPKYHMLVIKGFFADGRWITNDPGTRLGADFIYQNDNLMNAIHDWNGGDVEHGRKVMIVILPN